MSSDHSPILLTISDHIIKRESHLVLINKYTDWEWFKLRLDNKICLTVSLKSEKQLEKKVEKFTVDLQQSAWESHQK